MVFLLYAATAAALLWFCHRWVLRISRPAALILFLLPFCYVGYPLVANRAFGPFDFAWVTEPLQPLRSEYGVGADYRGVLSDVACQMIPWRKAVQWTISHHEWPLHNPFILSGDNLAAAAQPAAYSPFTLLACLLPIGTSFTFTAAMVFFIAGLSAFLFARELRCRESAALIASAGWAYSSALAFFVLWPLSFSWAFLPLVLLGVRRVVRSPLTEDAENQGPGVESRNPGPRRSIALLTVAFVLLLLAGHPETAAHVVFIGGAYALFELAVQRRKVIRAALSGIAAGVLALLICAVYILPIVEAAPQTMEQQFRVAVFASYPRGVRTVEVLARLATDFFPFLHLQRWTVDVGTVPFDTAAVGSIVLALAVYAVWRARNAQTWFFCGLAVFGLLSRAEWGPLTRLVAKLPLLNLTLNERFSFGAAFALALLAALGVEELLRRGRDDKAALTATIVLVLLTTGTILLLRAGLVLYNREMWGDFKIFAEIAGLGVAALFLLGRAPRAATAILALVLLQRFVEQGGFYKSFTLNQVYPPVPIFEPLKDVRTPFRVVGVGLTLIPGTSTLYDLEDPRGYEAMTLASYVNTYSLWCTPQPVWFNRVDDLSKPFLSFLNVRYAVVWRNYPLPEGWRTVAKMRGCSLAENLNFIDRVFVPNRVRLGLSDADALNQMAASSDFRDVAWIHADLPKQERTNGPGTVRARRRRGGYELTADMQGNGWVVVSETSWQGWRAYLDGRRVQMQTANTSFLSVYVPQGHHTIRLVYLPESFVRGRWISLLTLLAMAIYGVARRVRRS